MTIASGEEKPSCINCSKQAEICDYSIRLNWDGRNKRRNDGKPGSQPIIFDDVRFVRRQPGHASSLRAVNGHGSSSSPAINAFPFATSKVANQQLEFRFQSPFGQQGDTQELFPPFSVGSVSIGPNRPRSFDSADSSYPTSIDSSFRDMEAAQSMATLPQLRQFQHMAACPSTKASTLEISTRRRAGRSYKTTSTVISSLNSKFSPMNGTEFEASPERPTKRIRLAPSNGLHQLHDSGGLHREPSYGPKEIDELPICPFQPVTPHLMSSRMSNPMTPASSSTNSDDARQTWRLGAKFYTPQDHHVRRVSVNSLLLSSPEMQHSRTRGENPAQAYADCTTPSPFPGENSPTRQRAKSNPQPESYGLDRGSPDIDVPNNNDSAPINGVPPSQHGGLDAWLENAELGIPEFGFRLQKREFVFAKGGYYASPVPIKIPRTLQPLPSALLESPMNLLYFHHFLNHTAKVLVVHDCSQNPFRTILPQSKLFDILNVFTAG